MTIDYKTKGTCSSRMLIDVEDGVVKSLQVTGGCNGNLQGLSKLAEGMPIDVLIERLQGIRCGMRPTSCPDQLAQALKQSI